MATRAARTTRFTCAQCEGQATTFGALRKCVDSAALGSLWRATNDARLAQRLKCPSCLVGMTEVPVGQADAPMHLDVCRRCHLVWLDRGEHNQLPPPRPLSPPLVAPIPALSAETSAQLASWKVEELRQRYEEVAAPATVERRWAGYLGLPLLEKMAPVTRVVPVTWTVVALMALASLWAWSDPFLVRLLGFVPSDPWRHAGWTLLTSFFIHADAFHLLGNGYFLIVVGPHVEALLGSVRYGLLLLAGVVLGSLAHTLVTPDLSVVVVGASDGIAALVVLCALAFPHARVRFFVFHRWLAVGEHPPWRWFTVEIRWVLVFWLAVELLGALRQAQGFTHVSSAAHLGGALAGLIGWWLWQGARVSPRAAAAAPSSRARAGRR